MKKIFRYTNVALLVAAIMAVGAIGTFAQDPCGDAAALTNLDAKVRETYNDKSLAGRKAFVETGKQFLEKFGACEPGKDLAAWLNVQIPANEKKIKEMEEQAKVDALIKRFNAGLTSKTWDEVYAAGKELMQMRPLEFNGIQMALGSIGLDETAKVPSVTKWNEETLRFARQSISDLEAGKTFKPGFGVAPFSYKSKDDAIGWMNYTIGYIYFFDKKDKKQGLSYLYKASQAMSDTKNIPIIYSSIGAYYFDEVKKLAIEVTELEKKQDPTATEEVQKALVDQIKAKVALVNGHAEAAIDAYARALNVAKLDTARYKKEYTDSLNKTMQDLYNVRFGKMDGFDTFISNTVKKPMPNPTMPVSPISDPDPVTTTVTSGSEAGGANGTGTGATNGAAVSGPKTTTPVKATTTGAKATPIKNNQ